jgi:hypothetical protein
MFHTDKDLSLTRRTSELAPFCQRYADYSIGIIDATLDIDAMLITTCFVLASGVSHVLYATVCRLSISTKLSTRAVMLEENSKSCCDLHIMKSRLEKSIPINRYGCLSHQGSLVHVGTTGRSTGFTHVAFGTSFGFWCVASASVEVSVNLLQTRLGSWCVAHLSEELCDYNTYIYQGNVMPAIALHTQKMQQCVNTLIALTTGMCSTVLLIVV